MVLPLALAVIVGGLAAVFTTSVSSSVLPLVSPLIIGILLLIIGGVLSIFPQSRLFNISVSSILSVSGLIFLGLVVAGISTLDVNTLFGSIAGIQGDVFTEQGFVNFQDQQVISFILVGLSMIAYLAIDITVEILIPRILGIRKPALKEITGGVR